VYFSPLQDAFQYYLRRGSTEIVNEREGVSMLTKKVSTASPLDVAILMNKQDFRALEQEWEDLYHNSPLSTPFQSWSWLYSWWESYGDDYELRLITVRDGTLLVGIIPLMLERRWGFRTLLFIGKEQEFGQLDLLARKGWEDKVCEAGMQALRQMMGSWHVLNLQALSPASAAWGIFERWNGPRTYTRIAYFLFIEVKPPDELPASLNRNHRQAVRRALRRAEEDGVRSVLAGPEEAEQAARRLVALHRELRQGRPILQERLTRRFESFIAAAGYPRLRPREQPIHAAAHERESPVRRGRAAHGVVRVWPQHEPARPGLGASARLRQQRHHRGVAPRTG
jgi:CelD/BcsL family acetyltransferase involved in cellulose biosynthesis